MMRNAIIPGDKKQQDDESRTKTCGNHRQRIDLVNNTLKAKIKA